MLGQGSEDFWYKSQAEVNIFYKYLLSAYICPHIRLYGLYAPDEGLTQLYGGGYN
jgi:hypothetical protein